MNLKSIKAVMKVPIILIILLFIIFLLSCSSEQKGKIYSFEELWENRYELTGKTIVVESFVVDYSACTTDIPGTCYGSLVLKQRDNYYWQNLSRIDDTITITGRYRFKKIGCSGIGEIKCYPMERGNVYRLRGILKKETHDYSFGTSDSFYLELKDFGFIEKVWKLGMKKNTTK